jgi:hypothetical protein
MRFPSKGIGFVSGCKRGSAMTFFMPSSRTLREGQVIQEKTTVSSSLILAFDRHGKRRDLAVGHIVPPTLDKFQCAPCSLKTMAVASACLSRAMHKRFDALNHGMDQRSDVLSRAMDQRFGAFGQAIGQRLDTLSRMIDGRFATVDQGFAAMDQHFATRDALLVRLETKTTKTAAEMDAQLARLETKTATEFRHLRWGLGIVILLVLGLVTKVILDWAKVILDWAMP